MAGKLTAAARDYLMRRGIRARDIPPAAFAQTASTLGVSFDRLLQALAILYMGGQGEDILRRLQITDIASQGGQ